jgi:hypothetical protein
MNSYEIAAVVVALVGGLAAFVVFRRRHHCAQHDPLCRRGRPCIKCYRSLYKEVVEKEEVVPK